MKKDSGVELHSLCVDGGLSNSNELMQIQSDLLQISVLRPMMKESTALGSAIAAGIGSKCLSFDSNCVTVAQDLIDSSVSSLDDTETFEPQKTGECTLSR
jgi:glycerol kinase